MAVLAFPVKVGKEVCSGNGTLRQLGLTSQTICAGIPKILIKMASGVLLKQITLNFKCAKSGIARTVILVTYQSLNQKYEFALCAFKHTDIQKYLTHSTKDHGKFRNYGSLEMKAMWSCLVLHCHIQFKTNQTQITLLWKHLKASNLLILEILQIIPGLSVPCSFTFCRLGVHPLQNTFSRLF